MQYCKNYNIVLPKIENEILNTSDCEDGITRCKSKQHKKAKKKSSFFNMSRKVRLFSLTILV